MPSPVRAKSGPAGNGELYAETADYALGSNPPHGLRALKAGMVPNRNGTVTSAVLVHLRVEPAHFDSRWRERPALALLAWEALARDPLGRLRRIQVESTGTTINFRPQRLSPIATSQHRPC